VAAGGRILDVASGGGRHSRLFLDRGCRVLAVDRDVSALARLRKARPWGEERFDAVVVVNYLHRPLLAHLIDSVAPGGLLLYETFAAGNERFGRPRNPNFLLKPGELLHAVSGHLRVLAYEDLEVSEPHPAAVQRIAAQRMAPDRES
jgi:SAM-dependent methyltransferase